MNGWSMEAGSTARKVHRIANPDHRLMLLTTAGLLTAAPAVFYLLS
jgi:predicted proteasome-type protease